MSLHGAFASQRNSEQRGLPWSEIKFPLFFPWIAPRGADRDPKVGRVSVGDIPREFLRSGSE